MVSKKKLAGHRERRKWPSELAFSRSDLHCLLIKRSSEHLHVHIPFASGSTPSSLTRYARRIPSGGDFKISPRIE